MIKAINSMEHLKDILASMIKAKEGEYKQFMQDGIREHAMYLKGEKNAYTLCVEWLQEEIDLIKEMEQ